MLKFQLMCKFLADEVGGDGYAKGDRDQNPDMGIE